MGKQQFQPVSSAQSASGACFSLGGLFQPRGPVSVLALSTHPSQLTLRRTLWAAEAKRALCTEVQPTRHGQNDVENFIDRF